MHAETIGLRGKEAEASGLGLAQTLQPRCPVPTNPSTQNMYVHRSRLSLPPAQKSATLTRFGGDGGGGGLEHCKEGRHVCDVGAGIVHT